MLCFRKFAVAKKSMDKRERERRGSSRFSGESFRLTVLKTFVRELFRVSLISGIEQLYASEGYVTIFRRKYFVSEYQNFS